MLDRRFHAFYCRSRRPRDVAERIDQRLYRGDAVGPLAEVPVAVKDLFCTRGLPRLSVRWPMLTMFPRG
jgi:aspartyl-tRNA(Asn)/glutamyl-tRNA(Gln) amidotransferase subunit A